MNQEYDIRSIFEEMELELIRSMRRNLAKHQKWEEDEGINWTMWQAEQLKSFDMFKKENEKIFGKRFATVNAEVRGFLEHTYETAGLDQEKEILNALANNKKIKEKTKKGLEGSFFNLNKKKMNALINATTNDLSKAEHAMLRLTNDQYRKIIYKSETMFNSGGFTLKQAIDAASKDFLKAGINCVEYKDGRRVNIASYAEMCLRTSNKRAKFVAEGDVRKAYGITTVKISRYGGCSETCLPWQGRVYVDDVWSGGTKEEAEDKKLPLLSTAIEGGLFHPNCKHSMFTYYYDRKKAMGKLQEDGVEVTPEEQEHRRNHLHIQQQKRLEEGSLDPQNIQEAKNKKEQWIKKDEELNFGGVWDELFKQQRENKKNTPAPVNEKVLPDVFKKANSIEEATKFGKLYSKYDDFKVADDVKLEIVNGFNEAAYNVKKKYGRDLKIKGVSKMLGTNPNQAAIGKTSKIVELKNNSLSVLKKKAIKNFESNWNATNDVYGVFYHEIGHAVWDDLSNNARFEITSIYRKLREETYKEWQMMGGSKSMYKHADVFGMQLSRYGMTNEQEFFSEVFSQIMSGDISGVSKDVDDILMQSYRKSPLLNTINNVKQKKVDYIDVLHEYLVKKDHSTLSFDVDYIKTNHKSEVDTAMWLFEKLGGDILVLNESKQFNVKTADFLWNGKLWDLKDITSAKAADSAIRKGLKQIESRPGGIILNLSTDEIDVDELLKYVGNRIKRSSKNSTDILIKLNDEIIKLIRYKK